MSSDFLSSLNLEQRNAVERIYGPVLVMAGPGTGKTHMLTTRIAHMLQSDAGCGADNILCLTFTESAAVEMRNRLQKWIGPEAYRVKISTFHGFCQWTMDAYPEIFEPKIGIREVSDDLDKALAYRAVMGQKKWEYFSSIWDDFVHQRSVLGAISNLKREHLDPDDLREKIPEEQVRLEADPANFYKKKFKNFESGDWKPQAKKKIEGKIAKMYELADFWECYEKELAKNGKYDFDDMINWVGNEIETNEDLRLDLQEKFQWILVDEYQDTNSSQNAIVWQLCEGIEDANVFAVGDDDQSIYRFQGASVANIIDFRTKFPNRMEIVLEKNYRSHQNILDTAYASVSLNPNRANTEKRLMAQKPSEKNDGKIMQMALGSRYAEINFLVQKIQEKLAENIPANEIAILVRKNREIEELSRELPKFGIPISAQISQNIFENESVRHLILMLQIFSGITDDESFFDLLHAPFIDIPAEKLLQLSLRRSKERKTIIEILVGNFSKKATDKKPQASLFDSDQNAKITDEKLESFYHFFITARKDFHHCRPAVLAEKMIYESGMAKFLTEKNKLEEWQNIRKFVDWVREQKVETLPGLLDRISLNIDLDISVRPDPLPADKRSVQIMTAHKSKGMEFQVVFVPGLEDRKWGNPRANSGIALPRLSQEPPSKEDENAEERRIFFVALTRAKSQIFMSYSQTDFSGREKVPSQFWHEVPESIVEKIESDESVDDLQKFLPVFMQHQEKMLTKNEKGILEKKVQNFTWSASSLQLFLDCPRKFLYQRLYKFPRRPQAPMALGVALHEALERFLHEAKTTNEFGEKSKIIEEFQYSLRGQNLPDREFKKLKEHGEKILSTYFDQKIKNFTEQYPYGYELEYNFGAFSPAIDEIPITGKMDKIVYLDEKNSIAKIIDYKSGKPRPIKKGENYWRQLVFYDLLSRNAKGVNWQNTECEIEFLTPDATDRIGTRSIVVTEEDRVQVIAELKACDEKLKNLEFPIVPNPEGDAEIDFWQNFGK